MHFQPSRPGAKVVAIVMAGGEGSRLRPLTAERCKPAVAFGNRHRVVDFVLSNLKNSGIDDIHLLAQYRAASLIDHVRAAWSPAAADLRRAIVVHEPRPNSAYAGTADAVRQHLALIEDSGADFVAVLGADHIYRMDLRQMVEAHIAARADVSVAALPVALAAASDFGILETSAAGRIVAFDEKPAIARPMLGRPEEALASMGNYLFTAEVLVHALSGAEGRDDTDFGRHVLPRLLSTHHVVAYDFSENRVPGAAGEAIGYWRDVGSLDAYYDAQLDALGDVPRFDIEASEWPIHAAEAPSPPMPMAGADVHCSTVGQRCTIRQAQLDHAILRSEVVVDDDAQVSHSIVMDRCHIGRGARLHRVILGEDNRVPAGTSIGADPDADRRRFVVTDRGVTVVPPRWF